ncbi:hypothetical protein [Roseospirillum parvum]|uniref:Uncharacterized protein n=1 Tax=Roseospirillum parvum TaxID=83401 RepID=A0A1G7U6I0_9PROT|nr:hypothetical protein [Roseospirillum parvum]SDG43265.1 hypothetical protein SAMN05421742_101230 [Roseospirillum parvum]
MTGLVLLVDGDPRPIRRPVNLRLPGSDTVLLRVHGPDPARGIYRLARENANPGPYKLQGERTLSIEGTTLTEHYPSTWRPLAEIKASKVAAWKTQAASKLKPTDWYILRQSEGGAATPQAVLDYRAAVRAATNQAEATLDTLTDPEQAANLEPDWPTAGF